MPFKTLGLSDPLVQGILATGYTAPTAIQAQAIPAALAGKDLIGCAQTGTGKTAAFILPILDRLSRTQRGPRFAPQVLILTPTRELAQQIEAAAQEYGRFLPFHTLAVYGGVNIATQIRALRRGVNIVIATPGRLLDHMGQRNIDLSHIEVLVLDEADRMVDMGFIKDVKKIIAAVPARRQTLLFSATISAEVRALTAAFQQHPVLIQIGAPRNPIETITQHFYAVPREKKTDLLLHLLQTQSMYSVLVFSRTKHGADRIRWKLDRAGLKATAIHSGRTQSQRQRALDEFKRGKHQVLVATDIAARGLDVEGISHVINFDVPSVPEDYLHRIGRTGRAAATGDALTFVSPEELDYLGQIEKFLGHRCKPQPCPLLTSAAPDAAAPSPRTTAPSPRPAVAPHARPPKTRRTAADHRTRRAPKRPASRPPRY